MKKQYKDKIIEHLKATIEGIDFQDNEDIFSYNVVRRTELRSLLDLIEDGYFDDKGRSDINEVRYNSKK